MGNTHLFRTIVWHGMFGAADQRQFLLAYHAQRHRDDQQHSDCLHIAVPERVNALRFAALKARREWKAATNLASSLQLSTTPTALTLDAALPTLSLTWTQTQMLHRLDAGELEQRCVDANRRYGHGHGVTYTSVEEAILFKISCDQLDAYYQR